MVVGQSISTAVVGQSISTGPVSTRPLESLLPRLPISLPALLLTPCL